MRIRIKLTGTTPHLQHNEQLSDPDNKFTKAIKELTDKKTNQTDADRAQIRRLEWQGGLYLGSDGKIVVPTANVIRSLREAAALTKHGKKLAGSLIPMSMNLLLIYDGPSDLNKLYADDRFVDSRQAKIGRGRIKRTRPIFHKWALEGEFELVETALNLSTLEQIVERSGVVIGLGDARILGYGRYEGKVIVVKVTAKAA